MILDVGPLDKVPKASHGPGLLHMLSRAIVGWVRWSEGTVQWYVENRHMRLIVRVNL